VELFEDPPSARRAACHAAARVRALYGADVVSAQLEALYVRMVERPA
jgi:hypothetical protein